MEAENPEALMEASIPPLEHWLLTVWLFFQNYLMDIQPETCVCV